MTRDQKRYVLRAPALCLVGLIALAAASTGLALAPWTPAKPVVALGAAAAMLAVVVLGFMELRRSGPLVRLSALAGCVWLSFMFLETFGEILSR